MGGRDGRCFTAAESSIVAASVLYGDERMATSDGVGQNTAMATATATPSMHHTETRERFSAGHRVVRLPKSERRNEHDIVGRLSI